MISIRLSPHRSLAEVTRSSRYPLMVDPQGQALARRPKNPEDLSPEIMAWSLEYHVKYMGNVWETMGISLEISKCMGNINGNYHFVCLMAKYHTPAC